ncbi:MAG: hypothetical protein ACMUEM_07310 [Flavobacteriales bacterium AspAUS03]
MIKKFTKSRSLIKTYTHKLWGCSCDEADRGSPAGPVVAAGVILPKSLDNKNLDDSKKLSANQRTQLRNIIKKEALDYTVAFVTVKTIDQINILQSTFQFMYVSIR